METLLFHVYKVYNDGKVFRVDKEENCFINQSGDLFIGDEDVSTFNISNLKGDDYEIKIVRCTGQKDKNEELIFEDDIAEITYSDDGNTVIERRVIKWDSENCSFSPWNWSYSCDGCDCSCEIETIEIIGNIYDNPQLINE